MSDHGGGSGSKRKGGNKKQYYQRPKKQATDGDSAPEPVNMTENLQGFLISCNFNEYQTLKESYNVLNDAADRLYGPHGAAPAPAADDDTEEEDIEASIAAEIATLKSPTERRFIQAKTKCNNVLFIRTNDAKVDPNETVQEILDEIQRTGKANCRYIQRFLPVAGTFKAADQEKLDTCFREIFNKVASKETKSFSVMAKVRNNSGFKSETALRLRMIEMIKEERPNWILDHSKPKIMVLVNITQRAGCVSVVEDFYEKSKYNLVEYGKKCSGEEVKKEVKKEGDEEEEVVDQEEAENDDSELQIDVPEATSTEVKKEEEEEEKADSTENSEPETAVKEEEEEEKADSTQALETEIEKQPPSVEIIEDDDDDDVKPAKPVPKLQDKVSKPKVEPKVEMKFSAPGIMM